MGIGTCTAAQLPVQYTRHLHYTEAQEHKRLPQCTSSSTLEYMVYHTLYQILYWYIPFSTVVLVKTVRQEEQFKGMDHSRSRQVSQPVT